MFFPCTQNLILAANFKPLFFCQKHLTRSVMSGPPTPPPRPLLAGLLLLTVLVIATCGLIYELAAGALASYLLGDSITQFSLVIGFYLFAMGVGSYFSGHLQGNLLAHFINLETLLGLIGGLSTAILFLVFDRVAHFGLVLYGFIWLTGILVGLEIPLLMRLLRDRMSFEALVGRIFAIDYLGALIASLLFPLWLAPALGLVRTSVFFGLLNTAVALGLSWWLAPELPRPRQAQGFALLAMIILGGVFWWGEKITSLAESAAYFGRIVYTQQTRYQRLVLTQDGGDLQLYLNGNLQLHTRDEYRYHESLVHPAMAAWCERFPDRQARVLVLGGGDGCAARELLRYPQVSQISLVELDPAMTRLFSQQYRLQRLNNQALNSPRVKIIHADAYRWIRETKNNYDVVVVDFPDPANFALGKLYSLGFFRALGQHLQPDGVLVIQASSALQTPQTFWCIVRTLEAAGFYVAPYHVMVPSFGDWGFVLGTRSAEYFRPLAPPQWTGGVPTAQFAVATQYPSGLRFLDAPTLAQLFYFPRDMVDPRHLGINRLDNQLLVRYYEEDLGIR